MQEAEAVLTRLERIAALERAGSSPLELLDELRALVGEAEEWARRERIDEPEALGRCRSALAAEGRVVARR